MKKLGLFVILAVACVAALLPLAVSADIGGPNASAGLYFYNAKVGGTYSGYIQVNNNHSDTTDYDLYYASPTYCAVGAVCKSVNSKGEKAPAYGFTNIGDEAKNWVTIGTGVDPGQTYTVTVPAGKSVQVPVVLTIPKFTETTKTIIGDSGAPITTTISEPVTLPHEWAFCIVDQDDTTGGGFQFSVFPDVLVTMNQSSNMLLIFGGVFVAAFVVIVLVLRGGDKSKQKR